MQTFLPTRRAFLSTLALLPAWTHARSTTREPKLLLAREASIDIDPDGFLVSEKLDGVRAHWNGRELRFRSGIAVPAPHWFVARLPATPLDGELWLGRGSFESLVGVVRRHEPNDADWRQLRYMIFELPDASGSFAERAARIRGIVDRMAWPQLQAIDQTGLDTPAALRRRFDEVVRGGGEGLMLHRADAPYRTGRDSALLKMKPRLDAEAQVIGHVAGRGRRAGRLGALRVRTGEGIEFLIGTGFSDAQRETPPEIGAIVSFDYRGTTAAGVPRFASFLRLREF